jgi:hypothetical protein
LDGGTSSFVLIDARGTTLRGGFDSRIRFDDADCPGKCYVGVNHPSESGVRFLPLWSSEERELIHLLETAIKDTATAGGTRVAPSNQENSGMVDLGSLVSRVEGRRQMYEAFDQGLLIPRESIRLFSGADTARVESLVRNPGGNRFIVISRDADGEEIRMGYPVSSDSVMNAASFSGQRFDSRYVAGSWVDREMITFVTIALKEALERGWPVKGDPRDASKLLAILDLRRRKILENDADCPSDPPYLRDGKTSGRW